MDMELSFGEKIKLLRENTELSQDDLGKKVGMTQRKISYIEHNKYEPSMDNLRAFCGFFNISADYLLGFSKNLPFSQRKTTL